MFERNLKDLARTRVFTIKISKIEEEFLNNEAFRLKKSISELIRRGFLMEVDKWVI